ncbi:hypothetical protein [Leptospira langatensis]|uniref:hypothetical protein n=1 Tax=Leptospira langatensis TaxID=2484983 RepID=UPI001AEF58E1|nr:hypothetical protein [Leptospira langatensis]
MAQFLLISALGGLPVFAEAGSDAQASDPELAATLSLEERKSIHQEEVDQVLAEEISYSEEERLSDFPDLDPLFKSAPKHNALAKEYRKEKLPNLEIVLSDCDSYAKASESISNTIRKSSSGMLLKIGAPGFQLRSGIPVFAFSPKEKGFLPDACGSDPFLFGLGGELSFQGNGIFSFAFYCSEVSHKAAEGAGPVSGEGRNSFEISKNGRNPLVGSEGLAFGLDKQLGSGVLMAEKGRKATAPVSRRKARGARLAIINQLSEREILQGKSPISSDLTRTGKPSYAFQKPIAGDPNCLS